MTTTKRPFFQRQERYGGAFLTKEQRDYLVETEIPFNVMAVDYAERGKYGARWILTLAIDDDLGDASNLSPELPGDGLPLVRKFTLQASDFREEEMTDLHADITDNGPLLAVLSQVRSESGRLVYRLAEPE